MKFYERKIVIFSYHQFKHVSGAQKNCLIETVLLSTHNYVLDER